MLVNCKGDPFEGQAVEPSLVRIDSDLWGWKCPRCLSTLDHDIDTWDGEHFLATREQVLARFAEARHAAGSDVKAQVKALVQAFNDGWITYAVEHVGHWKVSSWVNKPGTGPWLMESSRTTELEPVWKWERFQWFIERATFDHIDEEGDAQFSYYSSRSLSEERAEMPLRYLTDTKFEWDNYVQQKAADEQTRVVTETRRAQAHEEQRQRAEYERLRARFEPAGSSGGE